MKTNDSIASRTALLMIDAQEGFHDPKWGPRNNPGAEDAIARALAFFRDRAFPVLHAQHLSRNPASPLHPSSPGVAFMEKAKPLAGERVFQKNVNSAFIGTELERHLRENGIARLVIGGIATDHCVSTTTRMAANLGFEVILLEDATATFDRAGYDGKTWPAQTVHETALSSLHGEFATVMKLTQFAETHA